jgi:hypothetical protein
MRLQELAFGFFLTSVQFLDCVQNNSVRRIFVLAYYWFIRFLVFYQLVSATHQQQAYRSCQEL